MLLLLFYLTKSVGERLKKTARPTYTLTNEQDDLRWDHPCSQCPIESFLERCHITSTLVWDLDSLIEAIFSPCPSRSTCWLHVTSSVSAHTLYALSLLCLPKQNGKLNILFLTYNWFKGRGPNRKGVFYYKPFKY